MGRDHTLFALEPGYVRMYKQAKTQYRVPGSNNVLGSPSSRGLISTNPSTGSSTVLSALSGGSSPNTATATTAGSAFSTNAANTADSVTEENSTKDLITRRERRYIGVVLHQEVDDLERSNWRDERQREKLSSDC
jgi:hypothetical protein